MEEVIAADLVVHVRDISHPETTEQAKDVEAVLETLGLGPDVPRMEIWNKTDLLDFGAFEGFVNACNRLKNVYMISSTTGDGVQDFLGGISGHLSTDKTSDTVTLNFSEGKKRGWLFNQRAVQSERQTETGYVIQVNWSLRQKKSFTDL